MFSLEEGVSEGYVVEGGRKSSVLEVLRARLLLAHATMCWTAATAVADEANHCCAGK